MDNHRTYFSSPKSHGQIECMGEIWMDALIQTTLEPNVHAIRHFALLEPQGEPPMTDVVMVRRREGLFRLEIGPAATQMRFAQSKIRVWTLNNKAVRSTPRKDNGRLIWRSRDTSVSVHSRMSVLSKVGKRGIALGTLCAKLSIPDAERNILHLVWVGALLVSLDRRPIGPTTRVTLNEI